MLDESSNSTSWKAHTDHIEKSLKKDEEEDEGKKCSKN
jgi:hypothetical protein